MTGKTDTRICNVCSVEKSLTDFYPYKSPWSGKPMWTRKCKVCQTEYRRERRAKERDKHNNDTLNRRRAIKEKAVEYKGGKCTDCQQVFPLCVYDFHHLDPSEKETNPGNLFGRRWENVIAELDKCVLLCANCHRIRHAK